MSANINKQRSAAHKHEWMRKFGAKICWICGLIEVEDPNDLPELLQALRNKGMHVESGPKDGQLRWRIATTFGFEWDRPPEMLQ